MDILNPTSIKSLIAQQGKWCVSLYMPTHRVGREQQQDPIRFKNLLAEAETKLLATGLRRPEVQKLMQPAEELLWNKDFWQHQEDGLAIFLTNDFHKVYRLPVEFEELLMTGTSFQIKPLLPCLGRGIQFYVLAVSLNHVRLFEGNADTMSELTINFPTSMDDALWMDDPEKHLNMHSGSSSMGEGRGGAGVFHGHDPADEDKKNIRRFFQSVNQGLNDLLEEKTIPMVLAGVDYLLPIYREASSYSNLLEDVIPGNQEREDLKQLHEKAWKFVKPIFEESQKKAFEKYEQLHGQGSDLATSDLKAVVKAATFGQIEILFVPLGSQKWGRYDTEKNKVLLAKEQGPENEDLFDFAASQTILNSGQVYAVPPEQMPGKEEIAAIL
ncbi:MAG: baeRF3 domain-containing protein, partial [Anaerolineales bacterium]